MGSILYIKQCPPRGGDTLFASMYAAYDSLSERMKTYLDGLTALHDGEADLSRALRQLRRRRSSGVSARAEPSGGARRIRWTGKKGALRQPWVYPLHHRHPPRREATRCLTISTSTPKNPLFQCRFRWTENAIAFWDKPLRPAPRDVGTTGPTPAPGTRRDGEGRAAGVGTYRRVTNFKAVSITYIDDATAPPENMATAGE